MVTEQTQAELDELSRNSAEDLVVEQDTGARRPDSKLARNILIYTAFLWSLFQLWIASPLQFTLGVFILDDTKTRAIHLGFAIFLAFLAYPMTRRSPRHKIPVMDWLVAMIGAFCATYLYWFYDALATRPGAPIDQDIFVACVGMLMLLEATRRALGPPLMIVAAVFLLYTFFGSAEWVPELIQHKGQSLNKVASHQWLSTEGVYGIALGVSTSFVFLFVLFGALLDKAGAGNYFIKLAFSMLGHLRGGPAKAAVLSSAMTGLISGSSIANVVTTGTFTIPLMRRVGFSREKGGAVEVASSVNGQIMPPVMGAAAFLMVEYIGMPYTEIIKHAFLPALISYIALLYMVHLEAVKANMSTLPKPEIAPWKARLIVWGIVSTSLCVIMGTAYYLIIGIKEIAGDLTAWMVALLVGVVYLGLVWYKSKFPDLENDANAEMTVLPRTTDVVKTGLHYILPIVVLVWCLMVERLSPGLSAFWATVLMMFILLTQKAITAWFRKEGNVSAQLKAGGADLFNGLVTGARNMIGIGVATAAAGVIVGSVSLTGVGQVMTEIIEVLSGGSFVLVLLFTALICIILGMGLPTTANYIVVASIMTPVIVELGTQSGMLVPLIAVHLFVFYFGIMADVTPPVGLASFAAAAVSGGDPIRTGVQAFVYSSRTVILPFLFIYNNELLLIGVQDFGQGLLVFAVSTVAILIFSAAMQGYFMARNRWYESLALLLIAFSLFNPKFWINQVVPPYETLEPSQLEEATGRIMQGGKLRLQVLGEDDLGDPVEFYAVMRVQTEGSGIERLEQLGLFPRTDDDGRVFVDDLGFNSPAEEAGLDFDNEIKAIEVQVQQPNKRLVYLPAIVLLVIVILLQRGRMRKADVS